MSDDVLDRPVMIKIWGCNLFNVQVCEKFLPLFVLLEQGAENVVFHIHGREFLYIFSIQPLTALFKGENCNAKKIWTRTSAEDADESLRHHFINVVYAPERQIGLFPR
jgi:hypothetical protein